MKNERARGNIYSRRQVWNQDRTTGRKEGHVQSLLREKPNLGARGGVLK